MDFGGFILFVVAGAALLFATICVLGMFLTHHTGRYLALCGLFCGATFQLILGLWLVKVYYLDDGLVRAAMKGDIGAVQNFVSWGADPEAEWEDGRTACDFANANGFPAVVDALKQAGAKR